MRAQGLWFRVQGFGFWDASGFRVWGLGFMVGGLEFLEEGFLQGIFKGSIGL